MKELTERLETVADLKHVTALLDWDQQTNMPPKSISARAQQLSTIQKLTHEILISDKTGYLLDKLMPYKEQMSEVDRDYLTLLEEDYNREKKIPTKLVEQLSKETSEGIAAWGTARVDNDFKKFLPNFKKILSLLREIAEHISYEEHPYDAMLGQYERGMKSSDISSIFEKLAEKLLHILPGYSKLQENNSLLKRVNFSCKKQKAFSNMIIEDLGFNFDYGRLDESAHPFTTSFTSKDVRLTTRINENDFRTAFYGAIHECGHGIYEQNIPHIYARSPLGEAASFGFHESQSRFYENIIARSFAFWKVYFDEWKTIFSIDENVKVEDIYKYINVVKPTLIRVEADEVTYNLHVIIRFEIEKLLFAGEVSPEELPEFWNEMYKKYLGISPTNCRDGVLQDIHWAAGLFGYFPTYTIGNLISVQLKNAIEKELLPLNDLILNNRFI